MDDNAEKLVSGQVWREWCDRLKAVGETITGEDFPADSRGRTEGFRALTRLLVYAVQMELEAGDANCPAFYRYETPRKAPTATTWSSSAWTRSPSAGRFRFYQDRFGVPDEA